MDPTDLVDYQMYLRGSTALLEVGESASSFELTVSPEAVALGLTISQAVGRVPALNGANDTVKLWLEVDPAFRDHPAYSGAGTQLGIELTVNTNSSPARRRQRTWAVTVQQL
jgi:hypothetical protein